jgi:hypothetical protein
VDDFVKKSSVLSYSFEALQMDGDTVLEIAAREGLWAHARAVSLRLEAVETLVDGLDEAELLETGEFEVLDEITEDDYEDEDGGS